MPSNKVILVLGASHVEDKLHFDKSHVWHVGYELRKSDLGKLRRLRSAHIKVGNAGVQTDPDTRALAESLVEQIRAISRIVTFTTPKFEHHVGAVVEVKKIPKEVLDYSKPDDF